MKIGILYSKESKTLPYQQWAEETLKADVSLINSRSGIINKEIDLLILVGGADVYPIRYGEKPSIKTGSPNIDLEWFDQVMLPQYIERCQTGDLAIFGICRGFQTLNVHFGGSLEQDINQAYSSKSRDELVDDITLTTNFFKAKNEHNKVMLNTKTNSLHHQGVFSANLADELVTVGKNNKYNNIEAFIHESLPIAGVQWHPEEIDCVYSQQLIYHILDMCKSEAAVV